MFELLKRFFGAGDDDHVSGYWLRDFDSRSRKRCEPSEWHWNWDNWLSYGFRREPEPTRLRSDQN